MNSFADAVKGMEILFLLIFNDFHRFILKARIFSLFIFINKSVPFNCDLHEDRITLYISFFKRKKTNLHSRTVIFFFEGMKIVEKKCTILGLCHF